MNTQRTEENIGPVRSRPTTGVVYFIEAAGLIKIGSTSNMASRFRGIRGSSPVPVNLIGVIPGGNPLEGILHARFSEHRRHGEWFDDCPAIRDYIKAMQQTGKLSHPKLKVGRGFEPSRLSARSAQ